MYNCILKSIYSTTRLLYIFILVVYALWLLYTFICATLIILQYLTIEVAELMMTNGCRAQLKNHRCIS